MIVTANVFPILQTVNALVRPLSEKRCFRTSFESQNVTTSETLVKSAWEHFYHIFSSLWGEIISKISPLAKFEILGVFVNTLTADLKTKNLFSIFFSIDGIYIYFKHFEKRLSSYS